ncbi:sialate:O-sulfotransferase 1-like isoform X2 [Watersipora subatra]|uniref:sialate:O-sulfotransferase 1-like isoform X2 n=1 Tax=Watersipora subatra TaxID=2589382 RepID=UPI00355C2C4E
MSLRNSLSILFLVLQEVEMIGSAGWPPCTDAHHTSVSLCQYLLGYTPYTYIPDERKYPYAVYGYGHMLQPDASLVNTSKFMFFKSHEPWWHENGKEISSHAKRAALLLRHPYDACYSEYKRKLLMRRIDKDDKGRKNAAVSVSLEKFIESETGQLNPVWKDYIKSYTKKWMLHAKYWLVEFGKPLHILVYNDVRKNTAYEIESLQKFFGYRFDGPNIRRHCCVMADSMNPQLKRSKSDVDSYKEDIYEKDLEIVEQINSYIARVHKLLGSKYPKKFYRVNRG